MTVIVATIVVYHFEGVANQRGHRSSQGGDDVPSPIERILSMGPACAQAVGVYNTSKQKKQLEKLKQEEN